MPIASGTWGSLGGVALFCLFVWFAPRWGGEAWQPGTSRYAIAFVLLNLGVALVGVWAAEVVARHLNKTDPGVVVIDEVSGQLIAYSFLSSLDWPWLLAGFLLFRALDIWKPFPARQAESLPGGWGIMADDWIAGAYTGLLLFFVQRLL